MVIPGLYRIYPLLHPEQAELRKRRALKLVVREHLDHIRVVHRYQPDRIEVRYLTEFFSDSYVVPAVYGHQRCPINLHVLVMIHREVLPVASAGPERRDAQYVGDKLEGLPVPGENHRTGA